MRGATRGPFGDQEQELIPSRRLTPSIGLAPDSETPTESANEDFLFHLYRGSELLQDDRALEAKEELERALHLQPHDAKGQDLLAVVYFRLGLFPRAISIYEQLRASSPRDTALLLNLALCYLKTGQAALARRDLELLVSVNPSHDRAWGYLGLACERLGALGDAERAFEQGGHDHMAHRMAERRGSQLPAPPPLATEGRPALGAREVVAAAFEELDAGELNFALAEPVSDSRENVPGSWHSIELGHRGGPMSENPSIRAGADSRSPDTKDGPPPAPSPTLGGPVSGGSRPMLVVAVPPPQAETELALNRLPTPRPPGFVLDESGAPSLTRPGHRPTLAPPNARLPSDRPPRSTRITRDSILSFPTSESVVIHASGVALVKAARASGFAARLEAVRASSNALTLKLLERQTKGKSTGEAFGGVGSPLVRATGEGQLVLAPRPGRALSSLVLGEEDDMCFVREDVLLGFDGELAFENGKLATGEGEFVAVVQLRGTGAVLLESIGEILALEVHGAEGLRVRREVVLGWFGRLVARPLAPSEAPGGQSGLVTFAGEGRVLIASA